jgi:ferric-dicitrate binding protein FerR (iron transport regulator)
MQQYWEEPDPQVKDDTDYRELLGSIHKKVLKPGKQNDVKWQRLAVQGLRMAASISLILFSVYFLIEGVNYRADSLMAQAELPVRTTTRVTGPGEKLTLTMPDKTKIIVNAMSEISFTSVYGKEERLVQLKGEAFFDIAPDSLKPFRVQTDGLTTTALGTAFNVFARDHQYRIALTQGKVRVGATDKNVELRPGQMALWTPDQEDMDFSVQHFNRERITSWKEGRLMFNRKPLGLILDDLAAWYSVEMHIAEEVDTNRRVIGTFENKNLKDILTGLSFSTGFDFNIKGKNVYIKNQSPMT